MPMPDRSRWKQLSPLLDELFDLDVAAREARLAELRALDAAIADDLEAMLGSAAWAEQSNFLANSAAGGLATPATLVGERIGAYLIEALLGQGGTGSVWRARRSDGRFEGSVAIKLLHLSLIGRVGAQRFEREGAILARLTHPHIARLLDAGVTAGGQPYLVLELVEGVRIDEHCDAHRLNVEQRLTLFDEVLSAVAQAHSHLVVHRDIKPNNVLVSTDGTVKLLDFGIAKLMLNEPQSTPVTAEGQRALTPEYAAPEQLQGAAVTTATDVYALGVLLYQLLVDRHPTAFDAANSAEVIRATLDTDPVRLSSALTAPEAGSTQAIHSVAVDRSTTVPRLRRALQGDLENIVARTLRKDPSERYQTVAALADDLRRYRAHEPVSARAASWRYRATKFARKHRAAVATACMTTLALVAATGVTTWQMLEARQQREEATVQAAKAEASANFLDLMVTEIGADGGTPTPRQMLDRGLYLLDHSEGADPRFIVDQLVELGNNYSVIEQTDKESEVLQRAETLARSLPYEEGLVAALCQQIATELTLGRRERAQARFAEAQGVLARLSRPRPLLVAGCQLAGASLDGANGHPADALVRSQRALDLLQSTGHAHNPMITGALSRLATFHGEMGDSLKAFEYWRLTSAAIDRVGRSGTIDKLVEMANEAVCLGRFGEWRRELELLQDLVRRLEARGASPASRVAFTANYGDTLSKMGQHHEALFVLEQTIVQARVSKNLRIQETALFFRAYALVRAGQWPQAREALDEIEAAYRVDAARNKRRLQGIALARTEWQLRTGDAVAAQRTLDALLQEVGYPAQNSWALRGALPLAAELALSQHRPARAEAFALAAAEFAAKQARDAAQSADVGRAMALVGRARQAGGNTDGAIQALQSAIPPLANGFGAEHAAVKEARALLASLSSPTGSAK